MSLSFYKNIYVFSSLERRQTSVVCDTETGRRIETATLTHNFSCLYHTVLFSMPHLTLLLLLGLCVLNRKSAVGCSVGRCLFGVPSHLLMLQSLTTVFWLQAEIPKLRLSLPVFRVGINIYHFITPTHFCLTTWLLQLIFQCVSCEDNLWWTATSRVNMQHSDCIPSWVGLDTFPKRGCPGYDSKLHQMLRLWFWTSVECGVLLQCNLS